MENYNENVLKLRVREKELTEQLEYCNDLIINEYNKIKFDILFVGDDWYNTEKRNEWKINLTKKKFKKRIRIRS